MQFNATFPPNKLSYPTITEKKKTDQFLQNPLEL